MIPSQTQNNHKQTQNDHKNANTCLHYLLSNLKYIVYQIKCSQKCRKDLYRSSCPRLPNGWVLFSSDWFVIAVCGSISVQGTCYTYRTMMLLGGILVSLRLSICPSVRSSVHLTICPSHILYPICSAYSSGWIHFIFTHLIKQLQELCCV